MGLLLGSNYCVNQLNAFFSIIKPYIYIYINGFGVQTSRFVGDKTFREARMGCPIPMRKPSRQGMVSTTVMLAVCCWEKVTSKGGSWRCTAFACRFVKFVGFQGLMMGESVF